VINSVPVRRYFFELVLLHKGGGGGVEDRARSTVLFGHRQLRVCSRYGGEAEQWSR
jgi:hypothetical protein